MQQNIALWHLFNSIIIEVSSTDIILGYLLLEATSKSLGKEEVLIVRTNLRSDILTMLGIKIITKLDVIIYLAKFKDKPEGSKKNRKVKRSKI